MNAIVMHDETTWPVELIAKLAQVEPIIRSFELDELAILNDYNLPYIAKAHRRKNPYHRQLQQAVQAVETIILGHALRGWHCSRLTKEERDAVLRHGMVPQTRKMLWARVNGLERASIISTEFAARLRSGCRTAEGDRGSTWFCFFQPSLAGEPGIGPLLRSWGGEALYAAHDMDEVAGPTLRAIGTPCLVEADVRVSALSEPHTIAIKFGQQYCLNRGLPVDLWCGHEDFTEQAVAADCVRRIVQLGEQEFFTMTGCDEWDEALIDHVAGRG